MYAGVLVGYFGGQEEARKAFRTLRSKGFRLAACVRKGADGDLAAGDSLGWRFHAGALVAFLVLGALAAVLSFWLAWPEGESWNTLPIAFLLSGAIGTFLFVLWKRLAGAQIPRAVIQKYGRWLVGGESVLILQIPFQRRHAAVTLLLEYGGTPPAVFIDYPHRVGMPENDGCTGKPMTGGQLQELAMRLSASHRLLMAWRCGLRDSRRESAAL